MEFENYEMGYEKQKRSLKMENEIFNLENEKWKMKFENGK
jgi:hypothetical protein